MEDPSKQNGTVSKNSGVSRRRLIRNGITALCGATLATLYLHHDELDHPEVVRHSVHLPGLAAHEYATIGFLTDLHIDSEQALIRARNAVNLLMQNNPDMVLIGGDVITYKPNRWAARAAQALAPLSAVAGGCYAVLGNHDWWSGDPDAVATHMKRQGINVLRNQSARLERLPNVWLVGMETRCNGVQRPTKALAGIPANATKLLLIHEPDYADEAPPGFALQLSGHSHGGQICAPIIGPIHTPKYARHYIQGLYQTTNHPLYVSRGIGVVGPQLRLFCPPEVTLLTITGQ